MMNLTYEIRVLFFVVDVYSILLLEFICVGFWFCVWGFVLGSGVKFFSCSVPVMTISQFWIDRLRILSEDFSVFVAVLLCVVNWSVLFIYLCLVGLFMVSRSFCWWIFSCGYLEFEWCSPCFVFFFVVV